MSGAQYDSWADFYDLAYDISDPQADVEFYLSLISKSENPSVLEMGCGSGRVIKKFAEAGILCTGIDLSAKMIEKAYKRLDFLPQEQRNLVSIVHADMTLVTLQKQFDFVIFPFSSICEVDNEALVLKALQNGYNHLRSGGIMVIDNFYYGQGGTARDDYVIRYRKTIEYPIGSGKMISFFETDSWDRKDNSTIRYLFADFFVQGEAVQRHYFEIKRIYINPEEMRAMLNTMGFDSIKLYGSYDFQGFDSCKQNKRQIWHCVK